MNLVKSKQIQMLGFTFMMMLFISMMPIRVVHGESGTKLNVDGTCINGTVSNTTEKTYYFETPANGQVRVGLTIIDGTVNLSLYRDNSYSSVIKSGTNVSVDLKAGTYYVKVTGNGSYQISANFKETPDHDKEPNDTMGTAIPLDSGVYVEGNAYSTFDDVDWYKFVLTTKSYINFELYTNKQVIFICDSSGKVVGTINQSGPMIFDKSGVYYIRVAYLQQDNGYYRMKGDIVEFPTPNEITGAVYRGSRRVDLTWSKSNYADGYQLFYKTSENGTWNPITTIYSGNTTSYTHYYGPSEGQTYYYGVMAFRKDKVYNELYNQEDAAGYKVTATKLPATSNANVKKISEKSIQVRWSVSGAANGYNIFRAANGGAYHLVTTIPSGSTLSWKDTGVKKGTNYTYKVVPYVISGGENCEGNGTVTRSIKLTGSISKVTGVKAKKNKSYNTIKWKKNSLATGYKVYRKEGTGSFKLIKTISSTSFKDKKVKKGKKYTYKIKAYYKNYTYNARKKKYTNKTVTSKYSKAVSVKR